MLLIIHDIHNNCTINRLFFSAVGSTEFIDGIRELAKLLGITNHPDHLITLEAIATLVKSRMSANVLKNLGEIQSKVS